MVCYRVFFSFFSAVLIAANGAEESAAFKQALEPIAFVFPADHASHAGFQTEWWYVTGNLKDEKGREFGFQFTIFRRGMADKTAKERGRTSAWAADDYYLLHLAISDREGKSHVTYESLERGALGIAGATDVSALLMDRPKWAKGINKGPFEPNYLAGAKEPFVKVWTKEASFDRNKTGWTLTTNAPRIGMALELADRNTFPIAHGEEGLSRKGSKPGQASYYYSMTKLDTKGTLTLDGKKYTVSGLSWMDHEFGSNQLASDQAGWEWFSIQMPGSEIMLYVLRNKDGSIDPNSSGTAIDSAGCSAQFIVDASMLVPERKWKSPRSGVEYVVAWTLKLDSSISPGEYRIVPALDDQEFHSEKGAGIDYYEGAIRVERKYKGTTTRGEGYLEVTGKTMGGRM